MSNTQTDLEFKKIPVSKRFAQKIGADSIEVSGNLFDCGVQKNGYSIVIGAIYVPSAKRTIFSAAACAPDDYFDMDVAASICAKRGLSQVMHELSGIPREDDVKGSLTAGSTYLHIETPTELDLYETALRLVPAVAVRAEERALFKEFQRLFKAHKTLSQDAITAVLKESYRKRFQSSFVISKSSPSGRLL